MIAKGSRADIILVDDSVALRPRLIAVIANGKLVHLTEGSRIDRSTALPRRLIAAI